MRRINPWVITVALLWSLGSCSDGGGTASEAASVCGDGLCDTEELCPADCAVCGDGLCDTEELCPADCAVCGDGLCESGEECFTDCYVDCPADCHTWCEDGYCVVCGDGYCNLGEDCPQDGCPVCGDGICDINWDCPKDCGICGDGICIEVEYQFCPKDCMICGDGMCLADEPATCPGDCVACGDAVCWGDEPVTCPEDCGGNNCLNPAQAADCSACSTHQNCRGCCNSLYPNGDQAFFELIDKYCACTAGGPCWALCEGSYICGPGPVNFDCKNCLGAITDADPCMQAAVADCHADAVCDGATMCNPLCEGLP